MNEYNLYDDGCDDVCMSFVSLSHETAVAYAMEYLSTSKWKRRTWHLYVIERDENPEMHNCIGPKGPQHKLFVHKFAFGEDGTIEGDETVWDESVDISFDSGTSSEIIVKPADEPVDHSGTANE